MYQENRKNVCLICNASIGVSTRKYFQIFEHRLATTDRLVVTMISAILGFNFKNDTMNSDAVCRKCFKVCEEIDELEGRISDLKVQVYNDYNKTKTTLESMSLPENTTNDVNTFKRPRGRPPTAKYKQQQVTDEKLTTSNVDDNIIEVITNDDDFSVDEKNIRILENGIIEINHVDLSVDDNFLNGENDIDKNIQVKIEGDGEFVPFKIQKTKKKRQPRKNKLKTGGNCLVTKTAVAHVIVDDKLSYKCLLCPPQIGIVEDANNIVKHFNQAHKMRLYICDICGEEFFKRPELSNHLDSHIGNERIYECSVCSRSFDNVRLYKIHERMHKAQTKNFTCEICGKSYGSRNILEEHKNIHAGNRPHSCATCGKNFTSKYTLRSHEKTHQDRPRPFICINCGKSFLTEQNLIHHERIHSGINNYICKECGKSFNTARNLETHFISHAGFKPFICRLCGTAFTKKSELRNHEQTHSGEKPYQCEFCGASFAQRSELQAHKKSTHYDDKRYKCTDCGRAFKRRRLLDYHMKAAHTGERPHKCEQCGATFIYPEHFKKHKLIHTGEKPYPCEVCGKAFNSRDNRNAHRFVHSDKKPYECPICGAGFMRKPLLYNHMNTEGHQHETIVVNQPKLSVLRPKEEDCVDEPPPPPPSPSPPATTAASVVSETPVTESDQENPVYVTVNDENSSSEQQPIEVTLYTDVDGTQKLITSDTLIQGNLIAEGLQISPDGEVILPESASGEFPYRQASIKTENGIQILQIRINNEGEQKQWLNIVEEGQQQLPE